MIKLSLNKILFESRVVDNGISEDEAMNIAKQLNLDFDEEMFSFADFVEGSNHEIEHKTTVDESPSIIAKIALDHLREDPDYYKKLQESKAEMPKLRSWMAQSAHRTGGGVHQDKRKKRNKNRGEVKKKEIARGND